MYTPPANVSDLLTQYPTLVKDSITKCLKDSHVTDKLMNDLEHNMYLRLDIRKTLLQAPDTEILFKTWLHGIIRREVTNMYRVAGIAND